jgi:hypothetical protein
VRWRPLLAVCAAVPVLAGCSGAQGLQAEQLLQQAQQAQKDLASETFTANLRIESNGQTFSAKVVGGGYSNGPRAGDMYVEVSLNGPMTLSLPASRLRVVKRGGLVSLRMGSEKFTFSASETLGGATATKSDPLSSFDIAKYVKDVKVAGGQVLHGKSVTKITGVLDTEALIGDVAKFGSLTRGVAIPDLDGQVSDTRVVAYVDDVSHLVLAALVDVTAHGDGSAAKLHLEYGLTSVNARVPIPAT